MSETAVKFWREFERGRFRVEHPLVVNARDGSVLVYVPAGEFEMGDGQENYCPKHRVELSGYWIGVYAVTNAQYLKFVQATGHRAPDNTRHRESGLAEHPVTDVNWDDSVAYANWAGCGLASEAQWEKACRGPLGLAYPWGNEWDSSRCRHDRNRRNETTSAVQGYPRGVSGYGTYNQTGNVWEWCADWYDAKYYGESPRKDPGGPAGGSNRVGRGGGWGLDDPGFFRAARRYWNVPGVRYGFLGLRLVRSASCPLP
ncbi:SUMF1/EgtB/PvdO family nonheme iron enzyme [Accumulibacter sp.]|uniref:formylglycine-generating enzyme family protein n=1 Tax=Accumulibacter sp. TaxID=2053492 RepID=UPI0025CB7D3D|nr:SUMF1/EgtB/PvdO family nonheme iron enzyme [Accumulibacter sp.]MCM8626288.1 formylglycine-generating enzyme family protein [Accumulibacter sp.]